MAPELVTPPAQPTGTPPVQPPPAEQEAPEQAQEQAKPLTREDVAEIVAQAVQRVDRSSKDRAKTITTEVTKMKAQLEKLAIPVTPEVQQKIQEQAEAAVDAAQPQSPEQPTTEQPATPAGDGPGPGNPVYEWTQALYKELGTDIKPADPEYAAIKQVLDTPTETLVKYQATVMAAIQKKQARVASQQQNPDARTMGGGQPPARPEPATAHSAWEDAYKK